MCILHPSVLRCKCAGSPRLEGQTSIQSIGSTQLAPCIRWYPYISIFNINYNISNRPFCQAQKPGVYYKTFPVWMRNDSKSKHHENPKIEVMVGDATRSDDVGKIVVETDVVVSYFGHVKRVHMMEKSHSNIPAVATEQEKIPSMIRPGSWFVA